MPLFVNIKNPLLAENYNIVSQFPEVAKDNGHDGIIWKPSKIVDKSTEFVAFEPNQIKSATDNIGTFSTENDDIQMAVGRFVDKYSLPKGELPALSNALSSKFSNKTAYGNVIHTANYEYTVIYRGVEDFDIIEYHPIDINLNNKVNDKDRRSAGSYDRLSARDELAEGECDSNNYDVTESEANKYNAGLDKETRQGEAKQAQSDVSSEEHQGWYPIKRDSILGRVAFVKGDGRTISTAEEWNNALEKFVTPQGTVYGFATKDGKIYLDTRIIRTEHPIHEYTHLWDRAVIKNNRPLWNRGVTLMRQLDLWNEILKDKKIAVRVILQFEEKSTKILTM